MDPTIAEVEQHKRRVSAVFDTVSADYDNAALRFFPSTAERMVDYLQPHRGWEILDVATGTGALCSRLAQVVGNDGRVTGIDLSEGMLARAEKNIKKLALENVDFIQMDAEQPEFPSDHFHAVTCSFGLFFIPDMAKAVAEWKRVTRTSGKVLFSSFTEKAFTGVGEIFFEDLAAAGVDVSEQSMASARLKDADTCKDLMANAGYCNVQHTTMQMGYHLADENAWWDAVCGAAMRGLVELVPESERQTFKKRHLKNIAKLKTTDGIWLDVEVRLTLGQVP